MDATWRLMLQTLAESFYTFIHLCLEAIKYLLVLMLILFNTCLKQIKRVNEQMRKRRIILYNIRFEYQISILEAQPARPTFVA